jgi:hypothetical protein
MQNRLSCLICSISSAILYYYYIKDIEDLEVHLVLYFVSIFISTYLLSVLSC